MVNELEMLLRLLLAAGAGAAVGLEREMRKRPAGLRTHMLVALGSTLVVLVSVSSFPVEIARIVAGVVTGIGFLGSGTIFRDKNTIRGLTTAASIWSVAGVGIALALGAYLLAVVSTVAIFLILRMSKIERKGN